MQNSDAYLAGPTAASLVTEGNLDLEEFASPEATAGYRIRVVDGRVYDFFPWTRSLFAVPFAAGLLLGDAVGLTRGPVEIADDHTWAWLLSMPPAAFATAAAALAALFAWDRAKSRRRRVALITGLGIGLTTGYWSVASRGLWQHGPGVLCLGGALVAVGRLANGIEDPRRQRAAAAIIGAGGGAAATMRPTFVVFATALAAWVLFAKPRLVVWTLLGGVAAMVPYLSVNIIAFGTATPEYLRGGRIGLHPAYLESLAAWLVSPSRGLLVFSPAIGVLAVAGTVLTWQSERDKEGRLLVGLLAGVSVLFIVLMAAVSENWWGGHSYGPRFLLDGIPVLGFLAVPAVERLVALPSRSVLVVGATVLGAWSLLVNAEGGLIRSTRCWSEEPTNVDDDPARIWEFRNALATAGIRAVIRDPTAVLSDGGCSSSRA